MRHLWIVTLAILQAPIAAEAAPTIVAVFDLETSGVKLKKSARAGPNSYLFNKVAGTPGYQVVPRAELKKTLTKSKVESYRQCYDQACQIEIGKELAAQKIFSTKILKLGSECNVSIVMYDLRTSATEGAGDASGACTVGGLARSLEMAVISVAGRQAQASSTPRGVIDRKHCPLPGARRLGELPPDGTSYRCVDERGKTHGASVQFHANGKVSYRAEHRRGKAEGPEVRYHVNGEIREKGNNKKGRREGTWARFGDSGVKYEEGLYRSGQRVGVWTKFNGSQGYKIYESRYKGDVKNGKEVEFARDGSKRSEGPFVNGNRQGLWTYYRESGHYTVPYKRGKRHGLEKSYNGAGQLKQTQSFKGGEKDGPYKSWRITDGKRVIYQTGAYRAGKKHGVFTYFRPSGVKRSITTYAGDKKHGPSSSYSDKGQLLEEGKYDMDKHSGTWSKYKWDGTLESKTTYKDGKRHGKYARFATAKKGAKAYRTEAGAYRNGKKSGTWRYFSADGSVTRVIKH